MYRYWSSTTNTCLKATLQGAIDHDRVERLLNWLFCVHCIMLSVLVNLNLNRLFGVIRGFDWGHA